MRVVKGASREEQKEKKNRKTEGEKGKKRGKSKSLDSREDV